MVVAEAAGQATGANLRTAPAVLVVDADVSEAFPVAGVLLSDLAGAAGVKLDVDGLLADARALQV